MPTLVDVRAPQNFHLWLRYDDGTAGEVHLPDIAGVFAVWNDPDVFKVVRLGPHGAIEWSPDLDPCPDAMYLRLTGKTADQWATLHREELQQQWENARALQPLGRIAPLP